MGKLDISLQEDQHGMTQPMSTPEVRYPHFFFTSKDDPELPASGELTIRFKKVRGESIEHEDGHHTYNCNLEVQSLVSVKGDKDVTPPSQRDRSTEDALDSLAREHADEEEGEY